MAISGRVGNLTQPKICWTLPYLEKKWNTKNLSLCKNFDSVSHLCNTLCHQFSKYFNLCMDFRISLSKVSFSSLLPGILESSLHCLIWACLQCSGGHHFSPGTRQELGIAGCGWHAVGIQDPQTMHAVGFRHKVCFLFGSAELLLLQCRLGSVAHRSWVMVGLDPQSCEWLQRSCYVVF